MTSIFVPSALFLALLVCGAHAQSEPTEPPPPVQPAEKIITKAEADELFRSVDELVAFASKSSGLPLQQPVKRELTSRDQLEQFLLEKMNEDEDTKRLERSEWVIKKFGLLPRDFELRSFIVKLLREQVAGFYDSKKKTVYLLDWISADVQRPVLAHELAHALQDQNYDLEKWIRQARQDAERRNQRLADAEYDEAASARSAVTEGQAMLVLLDYLLAQNGMTVADAPGFLDALTAGLESSSMGPLAGSAPRLIRESLLFPYRDGVRFTYKLMKAGGKERAFAGAFKEPPVSTRHILSPESYLSGEKLPALGLADISPALKNRYETYDIGSVGQFDVAILAREFGDEQLAERLSPHWRGGIYLAAVPQGKMATKSTADISLVYLSRWASAEKAREFNEFYTGALTRRFKRVSGSGKRWKTEEGEVSVETKGDYTLVLESFDDRTAANIRSMIWAGTEQPNPVTAIATPSVGEITLRITQPLAAFRTAAAAQWAVALEKELRTRYPQACD